MRVRSVAGVVVFVLGTAINPVAFWGCGDGDQPAYNFGEPEMRALLGSVEDSSGLTRDADGVSYSVEPAPSATSGAGVALEDEAVMLRVVRRQDGELVLDSLQTGALRL